MQKILIAFCMSLFSLCGLSVAHAEAFLNKSNNNTSPSIPYEQPFNGGKFLGCEIFFYKSDTKDTIYMHITNIAYYHEASEKINFEFNRLSSTRGTATVTKAQNQNLLIEFIKRRNICSFSPIQ